jgi:hypothetical protein
MTVKLNNLIDARLHGYSVTVEMSSTQLRTLHTAPVQLIAAPGAGKAIIVETVELKATEGTAEYNGMIEPSIVYEDAVDFILFDITAPSIATILTQTAASRPPARAFMLGPQTIDSSNDWVDKAVILTDTSDSTTGDALLTARLQYLIVDLLP